MSTCAARCWVAVGEGAEVFARSGGLLAVLMCELVGLGLATGEEINPPVTEVFVYGVVLWVGARAVAHVAWRQVRDAKPLDGRGT